MSPGILNDEFREVIVEFGEVIGQFREVIDQFRRSRSIAAGTFLPRRVIPLTAIRGLGAYILSGSPGSPSYYYLHPRGLFCPFPASRAGVHVGSGPRDRKS